MHFLLILVVLVAFYPESDTTLKVDSVWSSGFTLFGVLATWGVAALASWGLARRVYSHVDGRSQVIRWNHWYRTGHLAVTLGVYLSSLFLAHWGSVVRDGWQLKNAVLIDELLILGPFLASLILGWLEFYRVERALRETSLSWDEGHFWSRWEYVSFHVRHYLGLVLAPMLIFLTIHDLFLWFSPGLDEKLWFQGASIGFMVLSLVVLMPWLLAVIWGAKPLPAGPLRDRLEATARRLRFRYTDILLWNTRGGIVNAMVTGLIPVPRYVLLSDGLVNDLQPEEIEAVFGHEIGHVKHQHMPLYLGFLLLSLGLIVALLPFLDLAPADWSFLWGFNSAALGGNLLALALMGGYMYLVFGFLSRRCERQADVYGCKAVSCTSPGCEGHAEEIALDSTKLGLCPTGTRTFIQALEKVASLNGIRRDKPSWRHSSIARRVEFLENILANPARERRFQRRLFIVKCAMFFALCTTLAAVLWYPRETESPSPAPAAFSLFDQGFDR